MKTQTQIQDQITKLNAQRETLLIEALLYTQTRNFVVQERTLLEVNKLLIAIENLQWALDE